MPHDRKNALLAIGDKVNIPAEITAIQQGTDYCNVTLETDENMFPGIHKSTINLNSRQVEKV